MPQTVENDHADSDAKVDEAKKEHDPELKHEEAPQTPARESSPKIEFEPTPMPWSVASFPVFGDADQPRVTAFSTKTPLQEVSDTSLNRTPTNVKPQDVWVTPGVKGDEFDMFQFLHDEYQPDVGAVDLDGHLWGYKSDLTASVRLLMSSEAARRLSKFCISLEDNVEITGPTSFPICLISVHSSELYGADHPREVLRKNLLADQKYRFQPVFAIPREEFMFPGEEFLKGSKLAEDLDDTIITLNPYEHGAMESVIGISGTLNHISRVIRFFSVRSRSSVVQLLIGNLSHSDREDRAAICRSLRPGVEIGKGFLPGSSESVVSIPVTVGAHGDGQRWSVEPRLDALAKLCYLNNCQAVNEFCSEYEPVMPIVEYGGLWTQPVFCYDYPDVMATESEGEEYGSEEGEELFAPEATLEGIYQTDIVLPRLNPKTQQIHGEVKRLSEKFGITTRTSNVNSGLVSGTRVDLAGDKDKVQKLVESVRNIVQ